MDPKVSQKLLQFNAELKALCDKYLYEMKPVLKSNENSIYAEIQVFDIPPKTTVKEGEKTQPTVETKKEETPAPKTPEAVPAQTPKVDPAAEKANA